MCITILYVYYYFNTVYFLLEFIIDNFICCTCCFCEDTTQILQITDIYTDETKYMDNI